MEGKRRRLSFRRRGIGRKDSINQVNTPETKVKRVQVAKAEVVGNSVRFYVAKGLAKKQWVLVREIPVFEVESVESLGNELTLARKGVVDVFVMKQKAGLTIELRNQINAMLEDHKKDIATEQKATYQKDELLAKIDTSLAIVEPAFDILINLQEKPINWQQLESYAKDLGQKQNLITQALPLLSLDFSKIFSAINVQNAKETSKETFNILKTTYEYFSVLTNDDSEETHPNQHDAKALISAYYILNDLLLGKVVDDKDNEKEKIALETVLEELAKHININMDAEQLEAVIDNADLKEDVGRDFEACREAFREQVKQLKAGG